MYKIKFTKNAFWDISNIELFISLDNVEISKQVRIKLLESISNLSMFPLLWKKFKSNNIRELVDPNYNYRIVYEINDRLKVIKILNIFKYKNF